MAKSVLAALCLVLATGTAAAQKTASAEDAPAQDEATFDRIGVLEVNTLGVSEAAGELFEQSVENSLNLVGVEMLRTSELSQRLLAGDYVQGCTFGPCLQAVYDTTGLEHVLVARIHGEGQSYGFVVSLVETRTGRLTSQVSETCDVCTVEEAIYTATNAVIELVKLPPSPETDDAEGTSEIDLSPYRKRAEGRRSSTRTWGYVTLGLGLAGGAVGAYLMQEDKKKSGAAAIGGGGAFAIAGVTMLVLSRRF